MAIVGEVTLFLKEKRCRDVSDCSVFGCWAQKYAAARLPAVAEYSGAVVAVAGVCEAESPGPFAPIFPKLQQGVTFGRRYFHHDLL